MVSLDCRSGRFRLLAREQTGRHFAPHQSPTDGWRFRRTTFSVGKSINILWTWCHMLIWVAMCVIRESPDLSHGECQQLSIKSIGSWLLNTSQRIAPNS